MKIRNLFLATFFLMLFFGQQTLNAQQNNAELSGIVIDQTDAAVSDAEISLRQITTNLERKIRTTDDGFYVFSQVPPGQYVLTVSKSGFQKEIRNGINLTVGQTARLDVSLIVGAISAETLVTIDLNGVSTESSELSSVMTQRAIQDLPLNGRDVIQLALIQPGVVSSRRTTDSSGRGKQISVGGSRPNQVSFRLDGTDINDANNNTPGSASGVLLGVDTLGEFRVLTSGYSAEYGRSTSGIISAVTRSGTNDFHGSAFEFLRNSRFDARNYFDRPDQPIPPFKRNQFGAVLSGPIFRDKTFFLASYEGLRQRLGITRTAIVPNANARQGIIGQPLPVTISASVVPYLNLFPLPNGRIFNDGTGQFISTTSDRTDEDFFAGRVDHTFSERTTIFGRYWDDAAAVSLPDNLLFVATNTRTRNQYATAQLTRQFNSSLVGVFRFAYNRSKTAQTNDFLQQVPSNLSFIPNQPFGSIGITGIASLGASRFSPGFSTLNLFEGTTDISKQFNRHSLKFGFDQTSIIFPTSRPQSLYGFYQFNSLRDFLTATPFAVEFALPGAEPVRNWRQSLTAAYVQDDFRVASNLVINAGLRYEFVSVPKERDNLIANLVDLRNDRAPTAGVLYENPSKLNFAPRVGFAYDPFKNGKTSVRASFGIYYEPLWTDYYANAANRVPPYFTIGSVRNPTFPNAAAVAGSPNFVLGRLDVLDYNPSNPYMMHYNLSVQRQIVNGATLSVAYLGQRGVHQVRAIDANQALPTILADGRKFFPTNSVVRNPNFTGIRYKVTDGQSSYNGLQTVFNLKTQKFINFQASYTYSKAIDDGSIVTTQGGDNDLPQDPDSRQAERGLSNYDQRHYFATYLVTDIPRFFGPNWLTGGWQINTITVLASGNPFSVTVGFDRARARPQAGTAPQRPNLVAGRSNNPILGSPDRYFDPTAFSLPEAGFFGNLGRNTLIGPGLFTVDMSINKTFKIKERFSAQFRVEAFNILNRPNFAIPSQRTVFSAAGPVASAGLITSTTTTSRQLQFGLKLSF